MTVRDCLNRLPSYRAQILNNRCGWGITTQADHIYDPNAIIGLIPFTHEPVGMRPNSEPDSEAVVFQTLTVDNNVLTRSGAYLYSAHTVAWGLSDDEALEALKKRRALVQTLISGRNDDTKHALLHLCRENYSVVGPIRDYIQDCGKAGGKEVADVELLRAKVERAAKIVATKATACSKACEYDERVSVPMLATATGYLSLFIRDIPSPFGDLDLDNFLWKLSITFASLENYFLKIRDYPVGSEPSSFASNFDTQAGVDDPFPSTIRRELIFRIADLEDLMSISRPLTYAMESRFLDTKTTAKTAILADLRQNLVSKPNRILLRTHGVNPVQTLEWQEFISRAYPNGVEVASTVPCTYTGIKSVPFGRNISDHDAQLNCFNAFVRRFGDGSVEAHDAITVYVLQRVSTLPGPGRAWTSEEFAATKNLLSLLSSYHKSGKVVISESNSRLTRHEPHRVTSGAEGGVQMPANKAERRKLRVEHEPMEDDLPQVPLKPVPKNSKEPEVNIM